MFEPTSAAKSTKIFSSPSVLGLFPNHSINIITPNTYELKAMYTAAQDSGFFDSQEWWTVLDSFKITSLFRQGAASHYADVDVEILLKDMPYIMDTGSIQHAIRLLPYIPNILIKMGHRGVLSVRLAPKESDCATKEGDTVKKLRLPGIHADVCVQHYPTIKADKVVSVTGAGYVTLGY